MAADAACIRTSVKVNVLPDADGEGGGQKQLGLGPVVIGWADELAAINPPEAIATRWTKATGLLRQSGIRLQDAEELATAGDAEGSDAAQSEALWELQAQAAGIIAGRGAPFKVCFVERATSCGAHSTYRALLEPLVCHLAACRPNWTRGGSTLPVGSCPC